MHLILLAVYSSIHTVPRRWRRSIKWSALCKVTRGTAWTVDSWQEHLKTRCWKKWNV